MEHSESPESPNGAHCSNCSELLERLERRDVDVVLLRDLAQYQRIKILELGALLERLNHQHAQHEH